MKSIKNRLSPRQFLLLLSLCIGLASGLAANLLKWLIHSIEHLLTKGFIITQGNIMYLVYPCVGILLSALFIKFIVRDNIGHGVTKILYALSRNQGFIKGHNCWSSVVASAITIGCGGSVGAESPIVLTGSAIGSFFGRITGMDHRTLMILIGCGASGAVAGIFKAPIAGLVFTIEVLMIDLTMASLVPLLVSCAAAACVSYFISGTSTMFDFNLMHRPVFLFTTDIPEYQRMRGLKDWFFKVPFPFCHNNDELNNAIMNFDEEEYQAACKEFDKMYGSLENGTAAKSVVDRLETIMR